MSRVQRIDARAVSRGAVVAGVGLLLLLGCASSRFDGADDAAALRATCGDLIYSEVKLYDGHGRVRVKTTRGRVLSGRAPVTTTQALLEEARGWRRWTLLPSRFSHPPACYFQLGEDEFEVYLDTAEGPPRAFVFALNDLIVDLFGERAELEAVRMLSEQDG